MGSLCCETGTEITRIQNHRPYSPETIEIWINELLLFVVATKISTWTIFDVAVPEHAVCLCHVHHGPLGGEELRQPDLIDSVTAEADYFFIYFSSTRYNFLPYLFF